MTPMSRSSLPGMIAERTDRHTRPRKPSESAASCPAGGERPLTAARSPGKPCSAMPSITSGSRSSAQVVSVPATPGHQARCHFHPHSEAYCDDFSTANLTNRACSFTNRPCLAGSDKGRWYLVTRRMPWARYDYAEARMRLERYGIEQQAEIVKHAFWLRTACRLPSARCVGLRPARQVSRSNSPLTKQQKAAHRW